MPRLALPRSARQSCAEPLEPRGSLFGATRAILKPIHTYDQIPQDFVRRCRRTILVATPASARTSTLCTLSGIQGRFAGRQSAEVTAELQGSPTVFCARRGRRLAGGRRTSPAKPFAGSTQSNIYTPLRRAWLGHQGTSCIACSSGCPLDPNPHH